MPKLTDTQLVILSAAAARDGGAALPLPKSLKAGKTAIAKSIKSLVKRGLIAERPAARDEEAWREAEDGGRLALVITDAGLAAINADAAGESSKPPAPSKARPKKPRRHTAQKPITATPKSKKPQTAARQGTKQALLIDLLKRKKGATIETIVETLGWLPHTVRAALTRLRQKGLAIERIRQDGVSRYCIVENRKAA